MARKIWLLFVLICSGILFSQNTYNELIYKGNKKFDQKDYDASTEEYVDAIKMNEKDFTAHYNLGNALYKNGKFEEAKAEYQKAQTLAKNKEDKAAAMHNLGNAYMKTHDNEKAAQSYKESLKQDPYSEETRKNYEIAKLREKQQQKKQDKKEEQPQRGNGKDQKDLPQSDQEKQEENQQNQQPKKGGQQQQGDGQQQQGVGNEKGTKPSNNPKDKKEQQEGGGMPKDLEKAILNRVGDKEKETARRIMNKEGYSVPQSNEKDW